MLIYVDRKKKKEENKERMIFGLFFLAKLLHHSFFLQRGEKERKDEWYKSSAEKNESIDSAFLEAIGILNKIYCASAAVVKAMPDNAYKLITNWYNKTYK